MYNVMVVDDELIVRLGLKSILDWKQQGYNFEYEASNGKQALKILEDHPEIDIIITDINMPVMGGIELISRVNAHKIKPQIIVLSAFNDYELVREAFKLGIEDYIIKTDMDGEIILKQLNSAVKNIQVRDESTYDHKQRLMETKLIKEKLLKDLIKPDKVYEAIEALKQHDFRLRDNRLVVCSLWIDNYSEILEKYEKKTLKTFEINMLEGLSYVYEDILDGEMTSISPQEYVLFLSFPSGKNAQVEEKLRYQLFKIQNHLKSYLNISITIGVSDFANEIEKIPDLYNQAEDHVKLRFYMGVGKIIFPNDVAQMVNADYVNISRNLDSLVKTMKNGDKVGSQENLQKVFSVIGNYKPFKIEKLYAYYIEILIAIKRVLTECGEDNVSVFKKEIDFFDYVKTFKTQDEINMWLKNLIEYVTDFMSNRSISQVNPAILKAKTYIKLNYYDSNLSLSKISEHVGLTENRLSTLFSNETTMLYSEYLSEVRIEKAKELMNTTNMKLYEIAEKVGFSNSEYFSKVFKKVTGLSPSRYNPKGN